jgi:hypothetical protein
MWHMKDWFFLLHVFDRSAIDKEQCDPCFRKSWFGLTEWLRCRMPT